jgi:hypothetical protein
VGHRAGLDAVEKTKSLSAAGNTTPADQPVPLVIYIEFITHPNKKYWIRLRELLMRNQVIWVQF